MAETIIVQFINHKKRINVDLEIPLDITANELVDALNKAYDLGIDTDNMKECYLKAEDPLILLKGSRQLKDFGIRTGTILRY